MIRSLAALAWDAGLAPAPVKALVDASPSAAGVKAFVKARSDREVHRILPPRSRVGPNTLRTLRQGEDARSGRILADAAARKLHVTGYGLDDYPVPLLDLTDPPPLLFMTSGAKFDGDRCVAIVGSRSATSYGLRTAYRLGRDLGRWGWTVVSGMASGIDAAAHRGALDGGGPSVGVLGSGHDHEYPRENRALYARMREHGWLVSEFEPRKGPTRYTFPRRNRIIAALARAVVVVEAGEKSGALITADHALDLGRDVLAVPGRIGDRSSAGCLSLLKEGAGLVTSIADIIEFLCGDPPMLPGLDPQAFETAVAGAATTGDDAALLDLLTECPLSPDMLALRLGRKLPEVLRSLTQLEIEGWVEERPGGVFTSIRPGGRPA